MAEQHYVSIGEASKLVGLHLRTLRYLDVRGYVQVGWMKVGDQRVRVYDADAISRLKQIAALMEQGFPPRVAAAKVRQEGIR